MYALSIGSLAKESLFCLICLVCRTLGIIRRTLCWSPQILVLTFEDSLETRTASIKAIDVPLDRASDAVARGAETPLDLYPHLV